MNMIAAISALYKTSGRAAEGSHLHDAIGGGSQEGDAKVEPGGEHNAALIHNASRCLPDGHPEHICTHQPTQHISSTPINTGSTGTSKSDASGGMQAGERM